MATVVVRSQKRMAPCDSTSDFISNLPSNVIDIILIRLPLKDAARTSILSRRWRYKWIYIPDLVFYSYHFRSESCKTPKEIWFQIYQIVLLHRGPFRRFVLSLDEEMQTEMSFIDQLIFFLSGKDIQEFSLRKWFDIDTVTKYTLPSTLFQCLQLMYLKIQGFTLRVPPQFNEFSKLINVELLQTEISQEDFKTFISKCPVLRELTLQGVYVDNSTLEIDAPNLRSLGIYYFDGSILFKNVPVLSTLRFYSNPEDVGSIPHITTLLVMLPAIECFVVSQDSLTDFSAGVIPPRLPSMFNHLKSVKLRGLCFDSPQQINCALLLIRSSPNLQKLYIESYIEEEEEEEDDDDNTRIVLQPRILQHQEALSLVDDSFTQLQEVVMKNFDGTVPELEFLKIILDKSLVLKTIAIYPPAGTVSCGAVRILKAVTRLERASPRSKIIFVDGYKD